MTLNISFLVPRFPTPSETFIQAQVEGLAERGASVEVLSLGQGEAERLRGIQERWGDRVKVHFANLPRSLGERLFLAPGAIAKAGMTPLDYGRFGDDAASLRLLIGAARVPRLDERRVWLAHFGRWGRYGAALRDLGLINGPLATVFHGKDMSAYLKKRGLNAYARLFARGDLFLPISEFWREKLIGMGAPADRIMVHRMGVDISKFTARARRRAQDEPTQFIAVGRMVEKKGFDDVLRAFARFRAAPNATPARLTMIGDGPLRGKLEALAKSLDLGESVRLTGVLPHADVAAHLEAAHIFVLPSRTAKSGDMEGIPVALMEAMGAGMPVLATRHSGTPELVHHGVSGLLCDEGDWGALAENMAVLAASPERWTEMGAAGAARVSGEFDLKVWNDRLYERMSALAM